MNEQINIIDQDLKQKVDKDGKYLTFSLAEEEYGIGILKIKEIIGMMPITTVPQTPAFVKGVINLRGKVIPVLDLRQRFGMEPIAYTERTCIIVVEMEIETGMVMIGTVVDSVSEVLSIYIKDIEETPAFGTSCGLSAESKIVRVYNKGKLAGSTTPRATGEVKKLPSVREPRTVVDAKLSPRIVTTSAAWITSEARPKIDSPRSSE